MAFGSSSVSSGAGRADVEFRANIGKFRADVSEARQIYTRSTAQMSDAALRMQIAQEKLDRAIHRYGAESRQAKQATLDYRREMRQLETQADRTERELDHTRRTMDRTHRSAQLGGGVFRSMRSGIALATGGLLGATGLVYALRSTFSAAKESQAAASQLENVLDTLGLGYARHRKQIEETIRAQSKLSAFDDEDLTRSLINLIRLTGDVDEALKLNALATDVARGRNISLEAAQKLVAKAALGQAGALRRVEIDAKKGASAIELIQLLTEKYAGSAKTHGQDAAGAQERWNVALENAQEIVGSGLLPTLTDLFNRGADWLDQQADSGELQRKVNAAVEDGTAIVKGFAGGIQLVAKFGRGAVDALGGLENTVKALTVLWVGHKAKAILGFAGIATASSVTSRKGIVDATAFGRAWDIATRPRVMSVTTTTTGVPTGTPGQPNKPPTNAPRRLPNLLGFNLPTLAAIGGVIAYKAASGSPSQAAGGFGEPVGRTGDGRLVYRSKSGRFYLNGPGPGAGRRITVRGAGGAPIVLYEYDGAPKATEIVAPGEGRAAAPSVRDTPDRPAGGRSRFTFGFVGKELARLEEARVDADLSAGSGDDMRVASEELRLVQRALDQLKLTRDQRLELKRRKLAIVGEIESIKDAEEQEAAAIRERRESQRKQRRERVAAQERKAREEFERTTARQREQAAKSDELGRFGWGAAATFAKGDKAFPKTKATSDVDELRREMGDVFRDFMRWQVDILKNGSSVSGGNLGMHVMEQLTREQTGVLRTAVGPGRGMRRDLDEAVMAW